MYCVVVVERHQGFHIATHERRVALANRLEILINVHLVPFNSAPGLDADR